MDSAEGLIEKLDGGGGSVVHVADAASIGATPNNPQRVPRVEFSFPRSTGGHRMAP
jgi:hypothetical protein